LDLAFTAVLSINILTKSVPWGKLARSRWNSNY